VELEKPLDDQIPPEPSTEDLRCRVIIREYHAFLGATVKFLHEVQERQMLWRWSHESPVFEGVGWLQGLWASRSKVSSHSYSYLRITSLLFKLGFFASLEILWVGNEWVRGREGRCFGVRDGGEMVWVLLGMGLI
jgi:hypothetical protein